jgi:von Willebrand factor type A domain/Aerotolerance regulator N-terminal
VNFLIPSMLGFLGLIVPLVILYMLKLKRREVEVSSTLLWRKSIEDLVANAPFQRLRRNLLFFIQLIIIILASLMLARPVFERKGLEGQSVVALVDVSASMKTIEADGKTRMQRAKKELTNVIDDMGHGDQMMIVAFARSARVVETWRTDREALRDAVSRIKAEDTPTELEEALRIAETVAFSQSNSEILLISDGALSGVVKTDLDALPVRFIKVGKVVDNAGITQLRVGRAFDSPSDLQVFCMVENFGDADKDCLLEFYIDDKLADAREVLLKSGEYHSEVFSSFSTSRGVVTVKLAPKKEGEALDANPVDDVAYTILQTDITSRVLLVGNGNYFLEPALNLVPYVQLSKCKLSEYPPEGVYDITVFDGTHTGALPPGNALYFGAVPPLVGIASATNETNPIIADWDGLHPVLHYVQLSNLMVQKSEGAVLENPREVVAQTIKGPIIAAMQRDRNRYLWVGFDLYNSDWPLNSNNRSFPIFVANSVEWLSQQGANGTPYQFATGEVVALRNPESEKAIVVTPSGEEEILRRLEEGGEVLLANTSQAGIYQMTDGDISQPIAINLLSSRESSVRPKPSLKFGDKTVTAVTTARDTNREAWKLFAIAVFILLLLEWMVYCRRVWI